LLAGYGEGVYTPSIAIASTTFIFLLVSLLLQCSKKVHATGLLGFALGKREIVATKAAGWPFGGKDESSFFLPLVFISLINVREVFGWLVIHVVILILVHPRLV
jgi:hypothetical protein